MDNTKKKILVVDDEQDLLEILSFNLKAEGYQVSTAADAAQALALNPALFDLILLDVMMPGMSGFRLAEILRRERHLSVPIIFLTAKDTENDLLTGFSLGADDYVSKPFSVKELSARVKALLLRGEQTTVPPEQEAPQKIVLGALEIDLREKCVCLHQVPVDFTRKELEILTLLAQSPGRVFAREEILDRVWRDEAFVLSRTVDVHITRIRKKLRGSGLEILNRSGFGYALRVVE